MVIERHITSGVVVGHDFTGVIEEIGPEVPEGLRSVGERVAGFLHGGESIMSSTDTVSQTHCRFRCIARVGRNLRRILFSRCSSDYHHPGQYALRGCRWTRSCRIHCLSGSLANPGTSHSSGTKLDTSSCTSLPVQFSLNSSIHPCLTDSRVGRRFIGWAIHYPASKSLWFPGHYHRVPQELRPSQVIRCRCCLRLQGPRRLQENQGIYWEQTHTSYRLYLRKRYYPVGRR